jgi:hypothetical protein
MIMLGEPAARPDAANDQSRPADTIASTIDEAPLDYPFPGGKNDAGSASEGEASFVRISASIIAMAEPGPPVSFEQVAAVDEDTSESEAEQRREFFGPLPTVIRGGIIGNGGSARASVPTQKPVVANRPSSEASRGNASSSRQPSREPVPSPTPEPPPAGVLPQTRIQ